MITPKLLIVYCFSSIFICSMLWWDDSLIGMLSSGFLLGFLSNEFFKE